MSRILAFDFGASSGRAMIAQFVDGRITMEEIHRFTNDPVSVRGDALLGRAQVVFQYQAGYYQGSERGRL